MFAVYVDSDGDFLFCFPYDSEAATMMQVVWPDYKPDKDDRNMWRVKIETAKSALSVIGFAKRFDLAISVSVQAVLDGIIKPTCSRSRESVSKPAVKAILKPVQSETMGTNWTAGNALKLFE